MFTVEPGNSLRPQQSPEHPGLAEPLNMGQQGAEYQVSKGPLLLTPCYIFSWQKPHPMGASSSVLPPSNPQTLTGLCHCPTAYEMGKQGTTCVAPIHSNQSKLKLEKSKQSGTLTNKPFMDFWSSRHRSKLYL